MGDKAKAGRLKRFLKVLGPGLITGAADDDPSGIVTFSQAGAAFQYGLLWVVPLQLPLMIAVQMMCARIGLVSGWDLAGVLREHYPRWVLWLSFLLLFVANMVSIAADIDGIAAAAELLTGIASLWFVLPVTALIFAMLAFKSYRSIVTVFKWLTLSLLAYVIAGVLAGPDWSRVLRATFLPQISSSQDYLVTFVGLFGTTISPYLFFWQSAQEVDQQKDEGKHTPAQRRGATRQEMVDVWTDTVTGMVFSQVICYFIIIATGAVVFTSGRHDITTAAQAAEALKPVGSGLGTILFCVGLIGTGLLGVPTLAGSIAYVLNAAMGWPVGMGESLRKAKAFYVIIGLSMLLGGALDFAQISPVKLLFGAAVLNGLLAPPLLVIILLISNRRKIMQGHTNGRLLNALGIITTLIMAGTAAWLAVAWGVSLL